jgi:SNF2 family DNA or RNA helicase
MDCVKCGYETRLKFEYNKTYIKAIKENLPVRRYSPTEKAWYVPTDILKKYGNTLPFDLPDIVEEISAEIIITPSGFRLYPDIEIKNDKFQRLKYIRNPRFAFAVRDMLEDIGVDVKLRGFKPTTGLTGFDTAPDLYDFQEDTLDFLMKSRRGLIVYDTGLGKTIVSLEYANRTKKKSVLVVCPKSVTKQWKSELKKHYGYNDAVVVTGGMKPALRKELYDYPFVIASYDIFKHDKVFPHVDLLILDEITYVKNWTTTRSKAIARIVAPEVIGLSATPIENKLNDIYHEIDQISPGYLGGHSKFELNYVVKDDWGSIIGYRNLDKVHDIINDIVVQVAKEDVDLELPDKVLSTRTVELSAPERKYYEAVKGLGMTVGNLAILKVLSSNIAMKMKMKGDSSKEKLLSDILTHEVNGRKVIIFTQYRKNIQRLRRIALRCGMKTKILHGGLTNKTEEIVQRFEDYDSGCLIMTDVGKHGLNLQTADVVINFDSPYNPAVVIQREGRIDRIGSEYSSILMMSLFTEDSHDDQIQQILSGKSDMSFETLHGTKKILEEAFK